MFLKNVSLPIQFEINLYGKQKTFSGPYSVTIKMILCNHKKYCGALVQLISTDETVIYNCYIHNQIKNYK